MSIIQHFEGDSIASILKMEAALRTSFESFNPAVFKGGFAWEEIPFTEETGNLRFGINDSSQGTIFKYSGAVSIPRLQAEVEDALLPYLGKRAVLRITDLNGRIYIIGSPDVPVDMGLEGDTGTAYVNRNGYTLQFSVEQSWKAFLL